MRREHGGYGAITQFAAKTRNDRAASTVIELHRNDSVVRRGFIKSFPQSGHQAWSTAQLTLA